MKALSRITADSFRRGGMRGVNGFLASKGPPLAEDLDALAALGANHARVWLEASWNGKRYTVPADSYKALATGLTMLQTRRLYAVLVLSIPQDDQPWDSPERVHAFAELWAALAKRYRGRTVIAALDLLNEPNPVNADMSWRGEHLRLATAAAVAEIKALEPGRVVIVECLQGYPPWFDMAPLPFDGLVYSLHSYLPHGLTHQYTDAGLPFEVPPDVLAYGPRQAQELNESLDTARAWTKEHDLPVYVGEFGCVNWAPDADRYIADSLWHFAAAGWSWAYHEWRGWPGWDAEAVPHGAGAYLRSGDAPAAQVLRNAARTSRAP